MNKRAFQIFLTSLCFLFMISCGNKGDLYMPEKDKAQEKTQDTDIKKDQESSQKTP
jgi:predicted small lipoprotein YifL